MPMPIAGPGRSAAPGSSRIEPRPGVAHPAGMTTPRRISLPMYNLPEMRPVNVAFWTALRTELARRGLDGLPEAPDFTRAAVPGRIEPETFFTQFCGYPQQTIYAGQARHLAVPVYAAGG